jgi:hypothetical protein
MILFIIYLCSSAIVSAKFHVHSSVNSLLDEIGGGFVCYFLRTKLNRNRKQKGPYNRLSASSILRSCGIGNGTYRTDWSAELEALVTSVQSTNEKHLIVYTHNGFGNQLYQMAFAGLMAVSLGRNFHVADILPNHLKIKKKKVGGVNPDQNLDPNSWKGYLAGRAVLGFHRVDENWVSEVCKGDNVTFHDRKIDKKRNKMPNDAANWVRILNKKRSTQDRRKHQPKISPVKLGPKCIMIIGYFLNYQWFVPFLEHIKKVFNKAVAKLPLYDLAPDSVVIHLRCAEPHYMMLPREYYDMILSPPREATEHIKAKKFKDIWLAASPACESYALFNYLRTKYKAKTFQIPDPKSAADQEDGYKLHRETFKGQISFLSDFALLLSASTLILSQSTFSDWGALLSKATTIHAPFLENPKLGGTVSRNWSPLWDSDARFVYHDAYSRRYYGEFSHPSINKQAGVRYSIDWSSRNSTRVFEGNGVWGYG